MERRGFLGAVAALVAAPWVKTPGLVRGVDWASGPDRTALYFIDRSTFRIVGIIRDLKMPEGY